VSRRIDIEADHFPELVGEFELVGALERAHPMGLQHVRLPGRSTQEGLADVVQWVGSRGRPFTISTVAEQ